MTRETCRRGPGCNRREAGWWRLALVVLAGAGLKAADARPDVVLTRPGQVVLESVTGEVTVTQEGRSRAGRAEDRLRVDVIVATGRVSLAKLVFSNGASLEMGPETEIAIDELLQAPHGFTGKAGELKEEPSVSRTRVRLMRGEARVAVKRLRVAQGSAFLVAMPAGVARVDGGEGRLSVQMTEAGLGRCLFRLERGVADFEPVGGGFSPVAEGRSVELAVEINRATGVVTVGAMPVGGAAGRR